MREEEERPHTSLGLRHDENEDDEDDDDDEETRLDRQMGRLQLSTSFSEGVAIVPNSPTHSRSFLSSCTYATQQRFLQRVLYEPRLTPTRYSSTMVLYSYSTRKRFKDRVDFLPRLRAKQFSETIYNFPKMASMAFTSTLTHHKPRPTRRYTTGVELFPFVRVDDDPTPSSPRGDGDDRHQDAAVIATTTATAATTADGGDNTSDA